MGCLSIPNCEEYYIRGKVIMKGKNVIIGIIVILGVVATLYGVFKYRKKTANK